MKMASVRQGLGMALLGLLSYLLFLVTAVPAYWLNSALMRNTNGSLQLLNTAGTIWSGSGTLATGAFNIRVAWEIQPLWLLLGKARIRISSLDPSPLRTTLSVGYHQLVLEETEADLPASAITALYPPAGFFSPTGTVHLSTAAFEFKPQKVTGEVQMRWLGAGGRLGGAGELGDYQLTATGKNGAVQLRLQTLRGDVQVSGNGQWLPAADGSIRLDGTLNPGSREAQISPILPLINGRREGDHYAFTYVGRLALKLPGQ